MRTVQSCPVLIVARVAAATLLAGLGTGEVAGAPFGGRNTEEARAAFERVADRWAAGKTNFPLLSVEWFDEYDVVASNEVNQDGAVRSGLRAETGDKISWHALNSTNLQRLQGLILALPASASGTIPPQRRIQVAGIRNNTWFSRIYDRADIPSEVEQICDVTRGRIEWFLPWARSVTNVAVRLREGSVHALTAASVGPVAASISGSGVQIWDLRTWAGTSVSGQIPIPLPPKDSRQRAVRTNYFQVSTWSPVALSLDGSLVVVASLSRVAAFDTRNMTRQWYHDRNLPSPAQMRTTGQWCWQLAVLDGGRSLAVGLSDRIEKWSLQTGATESVLSSNSVPLDRLLKGSRDGTMLAADVGQGQVLVWMRDWTRSPQAVVDSQHARLLEISPDGRYLALKDGDRLVIRELQRGTRSEIPFRGCAWHETVTDMAWSPDGRFAAVDQDRGSPVILSTSTWKPIARWELPSGGIAGRKLAFSPDGWLLARFADGCLHGLTLPLPEAGPGTASALSR